MGTSPHPKSLEQNRQFSAAIIIYSKQEPEIHFEENGLHCNGIQSKTLCLQFC